MSHHYSGPQLGFPYGDARLDFNDLYVFPKPGDSTKSILAMNVHPSHGLLPPEPTTSVPFAPDAIYEIRIDTDGDTIADITYRVTFSESTPGRQTATLHLLTGAQSAAESPDGDPLIDNAEVSLGQQADITAGSGHRLFAGWRSDPFFFDPPGAFDEFRFTADFFADKDVASIVLEVPNSVLGTGKVGIWARTLTVIDGRRIQADRGALAAQSVFLTGDDRETYLASEPDDDATFIDAFTHSLEHTGDYEPEEARRLAKTLLPDLLPFDHTQDASYPTNGRTLTDDVMGVFLPLLTNNTVMTHGLGAHEDLLDDFPYLGAPHIDHASRIAS
jgi:hypothetical protein